MLLIIPHLNCNIFCHYCYEKRYRQKHKTETKSYDLEKMFKKMEELKNIHPEMCLHGGEPLMLPKEDVRAILLKIKELTGKSSIQTNGTLIDDDFIEIFKECCTSVGLSYDGPGELSEYRFYRLTKDPEFEKKIKKMIERGVGMSIIMVITKANAGTDQRLNKLKNYLLELDKMRITGRLNPCGGVPEYELDEKRLTEVYLDLAEFCLRHNLKWSPFTDIINGLKGKSRVCTFSDCDPFCTSSAAEMLGDGSLTNCMRTNKENILLRHPIKYDTRNEILFETSQEFGGCQSCQYWSACYGGCSTMTIDNDWRNRTYLCSTWKALFQFYDRILNYCGIFQTPCQAIKKSEGKSIKVNPDQQHADSDHVDQAEHQDHLDHTHNDVSSEETFPPPELIKELREIKPGWQHADADHGDQIEHQDHLDHTHNDVSSEETFPPPELIKELREIKPGWQHADADHGDWKDHADSEQ